MWLPHVSQQQEGGRCDNPQLPKALWVQRHEPKVWARARRWHNSSSFVVERLTGEYVMDHHTANQSVPLYDLAAHRWHDAWYAEVIGDLSAPRLEWATNGAPRSRLGAGSGTGLTPLSAATSVSRFNPAETPGTDQPPPAGVGRPRRLGHHHPTPTTCKWRQAPLDSCSWRMPCRCSDRGRRLGRFHQSRSARMAGRALPPASSWMEAQRR
jgi:hypothetical protein